MKKLNDLCVGGYNAVIYDTFSEEDFSSFAAAHAALCRTGRACFATDPLVFRTVVGNDEHTLRPFVLVLSKGGELAAMAIAKVAKQSIDLRIGFKPEMRFLVVPEGGMIARADSVRHYRALLRVLLHCFSMKLFDAITMYWIPLDSSLYRRAVKTAQWLLRDYFHPVRKHWCMNVPRSFEEFLSMRSKSHRSNIRRIKKKIERHGSGDFHLERFDGPEGTLQLVRDAERVASMTYQRRWDVGFRKSVAMEKMLAEAGAAGNLLSYVLYGGDFPCAFQIGILHDNVYNVLYIGHDSCFGKFHPGTYLLLKGIEDLCRGGKASVIDYGFGDGEHKRRFGSRFVWETNVTFFSPTMHGVLMCAVLALTGLVSLSVKGASYLLTVLRLTSHRVA